MPASFWLLTLDSRPSTLSCPPAIVYVRLCAKSVRNWRTAGSNCASSMIWVWRGRGFVPSTRRWSMRRSGGFIKAILRSCRKPTRAKLRERVGLVAHGGYGRRQQAPFSDVDLMILYEGKRGRADRSVRQPVDAGYLRRLPALGPRACARRRRRCNGAQTTRSSARRCWSRGCCWATRRCTSDSAS